MNTNHLKKFAQEARRKLLEQVGAKLSFVLTTDSAELREKTEQLKQLRQELNRTTKEQLIEMVAYTWFNRLMALRFMDVNDYQPLGIRIITPKDGYTIPEILDEAKRGNLPEELRINRERIYKLLDNKIPSTNPQNEVFKELLIATCNHLNTTFPFLFEKINDYTELLLPDDLTSDFSIIKAVRDGMPIDDCQNVEIIGWLYQFYISEEKDRLINAKKRYKTHEIAHVTQLFTPKWIVQYMVENTLGQFWKEARPNTIITKTLEFYLKPEDESNLSKRNVKSPEEISFFDPCVGSAHILCYAFDLFLKIYQEEGYNDADIPKLIITKNLYGVDIDERAVQLSGFALMMKGRKNDRRFLKRNVVPNIFSFMNNENCLKFTNATTLGSLIYVTKEEVDNMKVEGTTLFSERDRYLIRQASALSTKYDIIVTNPPYLNLTSVEGKLKEYIEKEYKETKTDLFACFVIKCLDMCKTEGYVAYVTPFVWMFIKTYEPLRKFLLENKSLVSLIRPSYTSFFESAIVPLCTFVIRNSPQTGLSTFFDLGYLGSGSEQPIRLKKAIQDRDNVNTDGKKSKYVQNQYEFGKISGSPIGYWLSERIFNIFSKEKTVKSISEGRIGLATGSNDKYLRNWNEVSFGDIGFNMDRSSAKASGIKWFPYNKGGTFRRWYGNRQYVINWYNDGYELQNTLSPDGKRIWAHNFNLDYIFKKHIGWSDITSSGLSFRLYDDGFLFDSSGTSAFTDEKYFKSLLGYLNTKFVSYLSEVLNPTFHFTPGDYNNLPFIDSSQFQNEEIIDNCITISKAEWDSNEESWDFKKSELIQFDNKDNLCIEEAIDHYKQSWQIKFFKFHKCEEEINRQINELYGVKNELTPFVPLEKVTIIQDALEIGELAKLNKRLIRDSDTNIVQNYNELQLPFINKELILRFVSYAVGCVFGRYSLDKEGLILANQAETLSDYLHKIAKTNNKCTFLPDEDNIIPVLDDDWFEDDIIGKFYRFLKVTFGEKNFNKNLAFIEEQLGNDIRKYFIKDFYPDHIKRYKKRPIYWMFSSPKGSFNVLIYMHRYTPDTVSNILNKYLKEFIGKLNTRKEHLEHVQVTGSASDKTKAIKEIDNIDKMLVELHEYERDILYPLATERIEIDLDDGVLVNYNKFGKAVKEVNGLNDPATKKKVKQFDWIDTSQIR